MFPIDFTELSNAMVFEEELWAMDNDVAFDGGRGGVIRDTDITSDGVPPGDRFLDKFLGPGAMAAGISAEIAECAAGPLEAGGQVMIHKHLQKCNEM